MHKIVTIQSNLIGTFYLEEILFLFTIFLVLISTFVHYKTLIYNQILLTDSIIVILFIYWSNFK